jgi:Zn-dependent protease
MRRGFDLFSIGGIRISIHYTWFVILGLVIWSLAVEHFPQAYPAFSKVTIWLVSIVAALFLFISVLLHELSHSFVANRMGLGIRGITLFIFGGIAQLGKEPEDPNTELKVAIAGPACSVGLAAIFFVLYLVLLTEFGRTPLVAVLEYLWYVNAALAAFNLVPGFPLDGGRVLRAIIWKRNRDVRKATRIASLVGRGFAIFLILMGLFEIFVTRNFGGIWLVLIGMFLQQAAEGSYQQVVVRRALSGLKVSQTMTTDVVSVGPDISLNELVESYFFRHKFSSFPVVDGTKLIGIVDVHQVKQVPRDEWQSLAVQDVMTPTSEEFVLHPDEDAADALTKMLKSGWGMLPVAEGDKLVGILTRRDVMSLLKIKTDLGS